MRAGQPLAARLDMDTRQRDVIRQKRKETKWNVQRQKRGLLGTEAHQAASLRFSEKGGQSGRMKEEKVCLGPATGAGTVMHDLR